MRTMVIHMHTALLIQNNMDECISVACVHINNIVVYSFDFFFSFVLLLYVRVWGCMMCGWCMCMCMCECIVKHCVFSLTEIVDLCLSHRTKVWCPGDRHNFLLSPGGEFLFFFSCYRNQFWWQNSKKNTKNKIECTIESLRTIEPDF